MNRVIVSSDRVEQVVRHTMEIRKSKDPALWPLDMSELRAVADNRGFDGEMTDRGDRFVVTGRCTSEGTGCLHPPRGTTVVPVSDLIGNRPPTFRVTVTETQGRCATLTMVASVEMPESPDQEDVARAVAPLLPAGFPHGPAEYSATLLHA